MKLQDFIQELRSKSKNEWGQDSREVEAAFRRRQEDRYQREESGIRLSESPR